MMRILVTGGAGYLGSALCERLVESHQVKAFDVCLYGDESLQGLSADLELIRGDTRHVEDVVRAVQGVDAVIHLAGFVGDPVCAHDPSFTAGQNFFSTQLVANVARYYEVKRFLFASSCSVYGRANDELLNEDSKCNPLSLYALDKLYTEKELLKMNCDEFKVGILRLATLFGLSPRPRFDLALNVMTARAVVNGGFTVEGGTQWRPFLHVRDAARAFELLLNTDLTGPINTGSNDLNISIEELGKLIQRETKADMRVSLSSIDARSYKVDFQKALKELEFEPYKTLDYGVKEIKEALQAGIIRDYMNPKYSNSRFLRNLLME